MENTNFRRLLLRSAVNIMACDGEVHADEVDEIKRMVSEAPYFAGMQASEELDAALALVQGEGAGAIERFLDELAEVSLSERQSMLMYEVLLRVTDADGTIEPSEVQFLQRVKSALGTEDHVLIVHFPTHIKYLLGQPSGQDLFASPTEWPKLGQLGLDSSSLLEDKE